MFLDSVMSGPPGIRVVLVQLDSEAGALCFSGESRVRTVLRNLPAVAQPLNGLEDVTDLEFEILRLRACSETVPDGLAPDTRWICGEQRPCQVIRQLDKHCLDVALSAGRHAAERAKLAGVRRLIGVAPSVCSATGWWLPTTGADARRSAHALPGLDRCLPEAFACFDPYAALRCRGRPDIAALVGVAIAAAQMGISFCLPDPAGGVAADAAVGLNPGVRVWLDPANSPRSVRSPAPAHGLCAV